MTLLDATPLAREILLTMERAFELSDPSLVEPLFAEDVLFLGGAATAHGRAEAMAYTRAALEHIDRMKWDATQAWTVDRSEGREVAVATGEMFMRSGASATYRLTLVLNETDEGWKIAHFHGSTPTD